MASPASGSQGVTTGEADEPTPEEWRDLIAAVVDHVVVESDGSLTLVGTGGGVIGRVASRTRSAAHHQTQGMCGRFTLTETNPAWASAALGVSVDTQFADNYRPRWNIARTDPHWIVRMKREDRPGA